jgi:hypothetical protein
MGACIDFKNAFGYEFFAPMEAMRLLAGEPNLRNQLHPGAEMSQHTHSFVEKYEGMVGFGLNRENDENTVIYYLQKFSDDALMQVMKKRLTDEELRTLFDLMSALLRKHLDETEYHRLFLKDEHP